MADFDFQPGDTIAIVEHRRAPVLYPNSFYTVRASEGWVVHHIGGLLDEGGKNLWCRKIEPGNSDYTTEFVHRDYARLIAKGPGRYIEGVSLPYSQRELDLQEFEALKAKALQVLQQRGTHEGWSNPATWVVALSLKNDSACARAAYALRRRDGTRNPLRLRKVFWDHFRKKEVIEPWMLEPPIDIPDKFARWAMPEVTCCLAVNWAEIELDLRDPDWKP